MHTPFILISNFSILLAAVIAIFRFPKSSALLLPFLCLYGWGLQRRDQLFTARILRNSSINNNIYVLLESLILLWQFKNWGLFDNAKKWLYFFMGAFVVFWIAETLVISSITHISSYFRIFYSFILVLMSINMINREIVSESKSLLKNVVFIICMAFIIFFTYKVLVEAFWVYGLNSSRLFRTRVYDIMRYINLFCNLIYAVAVLWVPRKQISLMPS